MQRCSFLFFILLPILLSSCGCSQTPVSVRASLSGNSNPPVLLKVQSLNSKSVRLVFDKEVSVYKDSFEPFEAHSDGYGIIVNLNSDLAPGKQINLSGRVVDNSGNTTGFSTPVWGYNSRLAGLLINELATKDEPKTELIVTSDGSTAGAVLYNGIPSDFEGMAMLPDLEVTKGDFIVIWWSDQRTKDYGNDVMSDISLIGRRYTNNGIQTLASSPAEGADVLDCVVYSNKSSTFGGYGNSITQSRVDTAVSNGWWDDASNPVDSSSSTKLRTMCRYLTLSDRNTCNDWYIAKDGGATFGSPNTSQPYQK